MNSGHSTKVLFLSEKVAEIHCVKKVISYLYFLKIRSLTLGEIKNSKRNSLAPITCG